MSILIPGLEMPTAEQGVRTINIYADGVVTNYAEVTIGKAIPVPEHGRLIDADELIRINAEIARKADPEVAIAMLHSLKILMKAPTIIEADSEEETE